ncbi:MAG TPA: DNA polymerase III subunit gamma/tau [Candidatus Peribacteria bacterium]|nr:DNA polymerase III subunit gamma/tau [Candidatus Peribacteria bacterium]
MTLYLKYRPKSFADVVGQDHVVTTLERAVGQKQLSHAYLLCGTRGTGKTSVARILAKIILCSGTEDEVIQKQLIDAVEDGSLVDLIEIDAASNRRIDDVRDLIERINFSPVIAKSKVYIIDEVHMLTKEAFNALLKTLEEPPPYAYFILATTELHKVPDTIQSRCQRFLFKRVKDDDITRRLQYIVDQEHIKIDRDALRAVARHATGSFRDAISLLDQLRSLEKVSLQDVAERIGRSSTLFIEELLQAVNKKDIAKIPKLIEEIEETNTPLDVILGDILAVIRTQMHEDIEKKADHSGYLRMMDTLIQALRDLRVSPVPGLVAESALLALCSTPSAAAHAAPVLSAPVPAVRPAAKAAPVAAPAPAPTPVAAAKPAAAEPAKTPHPGEINAEDFTIENVMKHWLDIVKRTTPPSARMSLKNAAVTAIEDKTLVLSFPSAFHRDKVKDVNSSRAIEEILLDIFKRPVRIDCRLETLRPAPAAPADTDLVDAAKEVFGM